MFYINFMATPKQKPVASTSNMNTKESKHAGTETHPTTKENSKRGKKEQRIYKTPRKQQNTNKSEPIDNYF